MKRFDENFTQLDGKELLECISETDRDGEWPERHKKTIIPYSLFGEDMLAGTESTSDKKRKQKGLLQLDPVPHFDLVIVDEAHNIRNSNTWAYQGVELFTRAADAVVFLTATPLQNSNNDLYTLLNLLRPDVVLDKDTFQTMAEPNAYINGLLRAVRHQEEGWQETAKEEILHILETTWGRNVIQHNPNFAQVFELVDKGVITREEKVEAISLIESLHSFNSLITRTRRRDIEDFCIRHTQTIKVPFTSAQQDLYDALMEFETNALTQMHGSRSVRFMMCTIMRQAASCIYGLAPFVKDIVNKKLSQIQEDGELYETDIDLNSDLENSIFELADELDKLTESLPEEDPNKQNELRTMRIASDKKQLLIDDLKKMELVNNNNATKLWNAYLKSTVAQLRITYDATTAKDNRDTTFLTQMHPLVLQAAKHESEMLPCEIGISVSDDSIPASDYEFLIYAWKYVGLRPDIKLIAVSDNDAVRDNVLNFMQYASDFTFDDASHSARWDSMDKIHYENWQAAKADYIELVKEDCDFRVEQLRQTTTKREIIIKGQIANATDERILRMRNAQLENLRKHYEEQKKVLEETIQKADIHTQPLVKGVLHVE